jgi:hypothetical protein
MSRYLEILTQFYLLFLQYFLLNECKTLIMILSSHLLLRFKNIQGFLFVIR